MLNTRAQVWLVGGCVGFSIATSAVAEWTRHTIDDTSRGADGVRLADANGDGLSDIVTGWEEGGVIRVYLHPGAERVREPWPRVTVGRVASPKDAVFADLDRDGNVDVISSCEGNDRTVYVHWAPAPARYLEEDAWTTAPIDVARDKRRWMFCVPHDVDRDGDTDLMLGSKGDDAGVGWLACPDDPRAMNAWTWHPIYAGGWIMSIQRRDMDADGVADWLVTDRKGPRRGVLWLGRSANAAAWTAHRIGPVGEHEVMFLTHAAESAGVQVVTGIKPRTLVRYARATGADAWTRTDYPLPDTTGTAKGVAIADIDGDGADEFVFSCEHARGRIGVGAISPEAPNEVIDIGGETGAKFDRLEVIDLDGDGDLDVLTCEEAEGLGVVWYENPLTPQH